MDLAGPLGYIFTHSDVISGFDAVKSYGRDFVQMCPDAVAEMCSAVGGCFISCYYEQ